MPSEEALGEYDIVDLAEARTAKFGGQKPPGPPLQPPGGGGTFDEMEARVAKLEAHVEHIRADVSTIKSDTKDVRERLIRIEEKIPNLLTFNQALVLITLLLGLVAAVSVFPDKVRGALGIPPAVTVVAPKV